MDGRMHGRKDARIHARPRRRVNTSWHRNSYIKIWKETQREREIPEEREIQAEKQRRGQRQRVLEKSISVVVTPASVQ